MLGSALDPGILIPLVVVGAVVIGGGVLWFDDRLDAAVAAAPSRQARSGHCRWRRVRRRGRSGRRGGWTDGRPRTTPSKPPANPGRTSRRNP